MVGLQCVGKASTKISSKSSTCCSSSNREALASEAVISAEMMGIKVLQKEADRETDGEKTLAK